MNKKFVGIALSALLALSLMGCGTTGNAGSGQAASQGQPAAQKVLTISAAASLQNALTDIQKTYEAAHPGIKLTFNFAASGPLEKQIEQGAPVDLFISAGIPQMDALVKKNLIVSKTRANLLGNDLVLIAGKGNTSIHSVQDLTKADVKNIGIGTPGSVPAGQYAQQSLQNLKLWTVLQPKFVQAKDVTQVLTYVEMGSTEAGFVYRSDAQSSNQVKVVATVPASAHDPIVYPAAVVAGSKDKQDAEAFLNYLESAQGQQVFAKYGFKTMTK